MSAKEDSEVKVGIYSATNLYIISPSRGKNDSSHVLTFALAICLYFAIHHPLLSSFIRQQLSALNLEDDATAASPEPGDGSADAAADGKTDVESTATTTPKLSKNQLKKLAKGQGGEKKKTKEKPTWNQPGEGKKAKAKDDKKSSALSAALSQKSASFVNDTPKGSKKDLSKSPMADAYHPEAVEAAWQDWWEASGYYSCDPASAVGRTSDEKFVMVIPPPNVTGSLHLGHALTAAVEDTLTRWHRMMGHATLYVPGESHLFVLLRCVGQ